MKKFISLIIVIILVGTLQSCRQDDENEILEKTFNKNINVQESSKDSASKDTLLSGKPESAEEADPPVKNGTHWRAIK